MLRILNQRATPVNLENLRIGIRKRKALAQWDDHNNLYMELERWRRRGIDENFWEFLLRVLGQWKAFRPKPKEAIRQEGIRKLGELRLRYNELAGRCSPNSLCIESLVWNDVSSLFNLAYSIKAVGPPTFGSKVCHFLFPSSYFLWDNKLIKPEPEWKENYKTYWEDLLNEWVKATDKESLKKELGRHIYDKPCASYPWATKIAELCQYP